MAQRIKGQEVSILIVRGGVLEDTLTNIMNFNMELQSETKSQGYLGETNNRTDDIFNQVKFDMELHLSNAAWFAFSKAILERQTRVTPDVQFNITAVLNFPNGDKKAVILADSKFGAQPLNVGSRQDYVKVKLDGMCDVPKYQDLLYLKGAIGRYCGELGGYEVVFAPQLVIVRFPFP